MKIIRKNSFGLVVGFVVLGIFGGLLATKLPIRLEPTKTTGQVRVSYVWAGASPELIEQHITSKLEGAFGLVQGVQNISSVSGYHHGYITIELDKEASIDHLRFELATLIRQLYPHFPQGVGYPSISLNNPNEQDPEKPLLTLQLNGSASASNLQQYSEEVLSPLFAKTKGVHKVSVFGGNKLEYVVQYDLRRTEVLHITEQEILTALQQHLGKQTIGMVRLHNGQELRVTITPFQGTTLGSVIIKRTSNHLIRLNDIATISQQEQPSTNFYRINGQNAINIVVVADATANQLAVADELKANLFAIQNSLPNSYQLRIEYDATEFIKENLKQIAVQSSLAVFILLVFIWFTSRSWRYMVLISASMCTNLLLATILFYVFKVEIHLYSLAALTTSLGIIIDNIIVMIDHYKRYRNLRVFTALLGATLSTCAGLAVLWFLPDGVRYDLWDFALVLIITLVVSLAVALFFIPAVLEQWQQGTGIKPQLRFERLRWVVRFGHLYEKLLYNMLRFPKSIIVLWVLAFGLPVFMLPTKVETENPIANYYNPIFSSDWYVDNTKPLIDKWLGGTLRLFVDYVYEGSYFTKPERTALYVVANLPNQSTIEQMNEVFRTFEAKFRIYPEIDRTITHVYNGQEGNMVVYFTSATEAGTFPYILKNRAIALSTEMSGISWDIYGVGQGFSQDLAENETQTFTIAMRGFNYHELSKQTDRLKVLLENNPRIQQVNTNQSPNMFQQKNLYEYVLQTKDTEMAIRGINKAELYQQLSIRSTRPEADYFGFVDEQYTPIKILPLQAEKIDLWQLRNATIPKGSAFYKLNHLARIERKNVTPEIVKENQEYVRLISFEYFGSPQFGQKFLNKILQAFNPTLPLGYSVKNREYNWWNQETHQQYELLGLVILLIYIICAIIFESLWQPLGLVMLIPMSFIGVFLAFYCFDFNFDQGGYASFVLLSGNVVCAGIFLISEYNHIKQKFPQKSPINCYLKAYQSKITPIFLTVISTILGLVPFLIYGKNESFWFALGVGTIGGLIMSLVVIFLLLPLLLRFAK